MKEKFDHRVVGDEDVSMAVEVVVGDSDPQGFRRLIEAESVRFFGEGSISVIVVNQHRDGLEDVRMAVSTVTLPMLAAPEIVPIPLDIPQYNEVEESISVKIDPGRGGGPSAAHNTGFLGYIGKGSVAIVVVELIAAVGRYVQVFIAVVVVIADRYSHAVARALKPGLFRDIFKCSVGFLMVKTVPIFRASFLRDCALRRRVCKGGAIDEEKVKPAIVVIVKKGNARTHGLNEIFLRCVRGLM